MIDNSSQTAENAASTKNDIEQSLLRNEIAGIAISSLAHEFGTPSYVYDFASIESRIEQLRQFDCIRYAQKALSNIAILDRMRRQGVVVDAVSAGEIHRALAAGFRATRPEGATPDIVFTADLFDAASLQAVVEHGIHVNCGSPEMISQLGAMSPGSSITLRINPGFGHGHSQKTNTGGESSKHGIWFNQLGDCNRLAKTHDLRITGLHMHIGSGTDFEHLSQVCDAMESAAATFGETLEVISAGGGLPIPYRNDEQQIDVSQYFQLWDATRRRLGDKFGKSLRLEIEPGRFLVAESGYLITEIRAIKTMGANKFFLVDAGFNDLARPILYGAYHPISICRRSDERGVSEVVVGGPLCESGDIFTQEDGGTVAKRMLPDAKVGDYLILEKAGSYGFVMASNYNSRPRVAEIMVEGGAAKLIRVRESLDDLIRGEIIPD